MKLEHRSGGLRKRVHEQVLGLQMSDRRLGFGVWSLGSRVEGLYFRV